MCYNLGHLSGEEPVTSRKGSAQQLELSMQGWRNASVIRGRRYRRGCTVSQLMGLKHHLACSSLQECAKILYEEID